MKEKPPSRATERRDKRRREILDVAARLFAENGYESVTLRAIADELGYAHAALYRYFPGKFSVVDEICRETFDGLMVKVQKVEAKGSTEKETLFQVSRAFISFCLKHPMQFRAVFFNSQNWGDIRSGEHIDKVGRECFDRLVNIFLKTETASAKTLDSKLLDAHTWWTSLFGTAQVLITSGKTRHLSNGDELLERQMEALWRGLH